MYVLSLLCSIIGWSVGSVWDRGSETRASCQLCEGCVFAWRKTQLHTCRKHALTGEPHDCGESTEWVLLVLPTWRHPLWPTLPPVLSPALYKKVESWCVFCWWYMFSPYFITANLTLYFVNTNFWPDTYQPNNYPIIYYNGVKDMPPKLSLVILNVSCNVDIAVRQFVRNWRGSP